MQAIDIENPLAIRRPLRSKVQMSGLGCDANAIRAVDIACPDLVSLWTCQMKCDTFAVRTEAHPIGKSFARFRKFFCIATV